jgi:DNA mismatch endonuclease (patch repair protein)
MPDVFTKSKRSQVMSRIRSRGNKDTEMALMRVFRAQRIKGWRRHVEVRVKGRSTSSRPSPQSGEGESFRVRPDFVFPKLRVAVFVDGCFWHGCPLHETKPKNNAAFWRRKLAGNKARDQVVTRTLRRNGWRVLRLWEHELARRNAARLLRRIKSALA